MKEYTIGDLLASDKLPGLRLAAGQAAVGNRIGNVNTIDNIDSYDWLRAGDLILTTGFIYKDDPAQLTDMVERLSRINCAGLGFKTKRYFDTIPRQMLDKADERGFPILEIPLKYALSDVSGEVSNALRSMEDTYFTQYLSIHNSFNECVLSGGGAGDLVRRLFDFVQIPIALVDSRWHVLSFRDGHGDLAALDLKKFTFPKEFLNSIPSQPIGKTKIITRMLRAGDGEYVVRIAQLDDASTLYGFVLAIETSRKMDWLDFVALEAATVPLVLESVKAKQISEVKHQLRQDFFDDLLQGRLESANAVSSLAEIHNMDIKKTYMCMVIRLDGNPGLDAGELGRNRLLKIKEDIKYTVERLSKQHDLSSVAIHRSDTIIAFICVPDARRHQRSWEILEGLPEELAEEIQRTYPIRLKIGVGTPTEDFLNLRSSFVQASEALRLAEKNDRFAAGYYENFMVDQLIGAIPDREILEQFAELSLGALRQYDADHGTNLVRTLEIYFECNGNVSIAAKKLFLHRNSLIYRMDRIKEVLNSELKDASELLTLQVGLRVLKVLESDPG